MNAAERANKIEKKLLSDLGAERNTFSFLVPEWEPEKIEMGIRWLRSSVREGFYVDYKIDYEAGLVYLKSWEGEEEPAWDELRFKT